MGNIYINQIAVLKKKRLALAIDCVKSLIK